MILEVHVLYHKIVGNNTIRFSDNAINLFTNQIYEFRILTEYLLKNFLLLEDSTLFPQ